MPAAALHDRKPEVFESEEHLRIDEEHRSDSSIKVVPGDISLRCLFGHRWARARLDEQSCTIDRECSDCRRFERFAVEHTWGEWVAVAGTCGRERRCRVCPKVQRIEPHRWSDWRPLDGARDIRECAAESCAAREQRLIPHSWGAAELQDGPVSHGGPQFMEISHCAVCGCSDLAASEGCHREA
jgi:hypothetical protein